MKVTVRWRPSTQPGRWMESVHQTKYVTVGVAGELELTDANGIWARTFAPGMWISVERTHPREELPGTRSA